MVSTALKQILFAPFVPTQLPGLVAWYAADAITGLADGDPVATWLDLSGLGNHLTQATGSKRPTWKANQINGRPAVLFDGVDDLLAAAFTLIQPWTAIVVAKMVTVPNPTNYIMDGAVQNKGVVLVTNGGVLQMYAGSSVVGTSAFGTSAFHVARAQFNGASSQVFLDGASAGSGNAGTGIPAGITIGASGTPAAAWSNSLVAAALVYNAILSASDIARLSNGWVRPLYGISGA